MCIRDRVTGVSHILPTGLSDINNLEVYSFLGDHSFVNFYGFLLGEVNILLHKPHFNLHPRKIQQAMGFYNGCVCKRNRTIFNPYSITIFYKPSKLRVTGIKVDYTLHAFNMLEYQEMALNIILLLSCLLYTSRCV